ncbi:metallophosphoesterase 1 isoform X3 [Heterocephalus glaber]|uniref:Metallophosphoesterase 1 n=1 Tax=Heterocephalus glaber TaxID=10181 RepID=A0AAX6TJP6_HETGA|nr:metallophosphoesterase 1 isoform X3 [Heterocephalus glaber]
MKAVQLDSICTLPASAVPLRTLDGLGPGAWASKAGAMGPAGWGLGRQGLRLLKRSLLPLKLTAIIFAGLLFCEFFIYYLVICRCHWAEVEAPAWGGEPLAPVLRAMVLADTHLLGEVQGHWLDKLRREWQMERAFQTALWVLQPEVVFILGDIFDEGKWSSPQAWADDVGRFHRMFRHPAHVQLKVVAGNHDIGFHYWMNSFRVKRFEKAFSSERLFSRKGVNFVMVNSVAMEGDACNICAKAEAELLQVSRRLNCSREVPGSGPCGAGQQLSPSAPILLQLLWWLQPRLVLSGHTHSACEVLHGAGVPEISVPSFSWRNRNNPSFVMVSLTSRDFALSKCFLPQEDTVLATYCGVVGLLVVLVLAHTERLASPFLSGWNELRRHRSW